MPQYLIRGKPKSSMDQDLPRIPWSSGRLLSDAQRDRKRRMNRTSQLRRREALKNSLKSIDNRLLHMEQRCLALLPSPSNNLGACTDIGRFTLNDCAHNGTSLCDSLNEILRSVCLFKPLQVCSNDHFNQDALIRGVILGWNVLQHEYFTCPIWSILHRIDALLMADTTVATRLALLRGIHLLLLSRVCPDRPPCLPPWFCPRRAKPSKPHSTVIDYFAWPRFRERLITLNYPHLTNRFWYFFTRNVKFEWPFSPAHTIDMDQNSGKYHFSGPFRDATDCIERFTIGPEFFFVYPDCREDIEPSHKL